MNRDGTIASWLPNIFRGKEQGQVSAQSHSCSSASSGEVYVDPHLNEAKFTLAGLDGQVGIANDGRFRVSQSQFEELSGWSEKSGIGIHSETDADGTILIKLSDNK